jgi:hypothetical protein
MFGEGDRKRADMATCIRIHTTKHLTDGHTAPAAEYNLPDFGGQLPEVGDTILPDPARAEAGVLWDVISRYHEPGDAYDASACIRIVVTERAPKPEELVLFGE